MLGKGRRQRLQDHLDHAAGRAFIGALDQFLIDLRCFRNDKLVQLVCETEPYIPVSQRSGKLSSKASPFGGKGTYSLFEGTRKPATFCAKEVCFMVLLIGFGMFMNFSKDGELSTPSSWVMIILINDTNVKSGG